MSTSICDKCGQPLAFKRIANGKWSPTNPDGSDHWDRCKRISLRKAGKRLMTRELTHMTVPLGDMPMITSNVPPWDESIVEDWNWCRGHKVVAVEVQREYQEP